MLWPEPPAGNRASAQGTSRILEKNRLISSDEYVRAWTFSPQTREDAVQPGEIFRKALASDESGIDNA